MTPTQRSVARLRLAGYEVWIVEHWNPWAKIRQDMFGFADILAFTCQLPVMLVQTTTGANTAARRKKILGNRVAKAWVNAGHEIAIHSWAMRGPKGKRKVWTCEAEWITPGMFNGGPHGESQRSGT